MLAGDIHGDLGAGRQLLARAKREDCTLVFFLGDFGYWEHRPSGVEFLDKLNVAARSNVMPIFFLDGNHDKTSLLVEKYAHTAADNDGFMQVRSSVMYAPRGHRWEWEDISFIALGGAYSVDKEWRLVQEARRGESETLWFPEEEMTDDDMARILEVDDYPVNVMLAHDKPLWSRPAWNRKNIDECLPNQRRLQSAVNALHPMLFVHGHLHYEYTDVIGPPIANREEVCVVRGLQANREAFEPHRIGHQWTLESTYLVLDLDETFDDQVEEMGGGIQHGWQASQAAGPGTDHRPAA